MLNKIKYIIKIFQKIKNLPQVNIMFCNANNISLDDYKATYRYFTKRHRLKLFKNKTIGIALLDLSCFDTFEEYLASINGKNSAAYYARKAVKRGYKFIEINRNEYIDDIYRINTSATIRQGKEMSQQYLQKQEKYVDKENYRYFGIIDEKGILRSYCNIGFYGEFTLVSSLLGDKNYLNDGIMYMMLIEFHKLMFQKYRDNGYKYVMYDTFFGASDGLVKFKNKLGYKPYKVKWLWEY